jgi:hypothetical protein
MPRYQFSDEENLQFELLPAGEYRFEVISASQSIVNSGGPANGSERLEIKIRIEDDQGNRRAQWTEQLIFHSSCAWKIDTFVKASNFLVDGASPRKGEDLDINESNIRGLRGWCYIGVEEYTKNGVKRQANRVKTWLTDKPKLPKHAIDPTDVPRTVPAFDSGDDDGD